MYIEKDYILRLIHEIIRMLFRLLTGKESASEEDAAFSLENEEFYRSLISMAERGEINTAEDNMLGYVDLTSKQDIQLALLFYRRLNEMDDLFLTEHDFSREEILDGVKHIADGHGYGAIAEMLMEDD